MSKNILENISIGDEITIKHKSEIQSLLFKVKNFHETTLQLKNQKLFTKKANDYNNHLASVIKSKDKEINKLRDQIDSFYKKLGEQDD